LTIYLDGRTYRIMVIALFILLCLIWGSTWMAIKIGLEDAPPMYTLSVRLLLSLVVFHILARLKRVALPRGVRSWLRLGYPGLFIYGLSYAPVYWAETYINSALTAVLFASFPFFVALFSLGLLRVERLGLTAWLGLAVGFTGIVVVSYDSLQTGPDLFVGSLLVLLATMAAAAGAVFHKRSFSQQNVYLSAVAQITVGTLPVILITPLVENIGDFALTATSVGSILYLTVIGTVVAFLAYYWLLSRTRAIYTSLFAFVVPLVAIFIGVVLFDESLTLTIVFGTVMILSGVVLVVIKPQTEQKTPR